MANRVDIKIGYSIDKTGLNELQKVLDDISVQAKKPGQEMNKDLQNAAKTARQLSDILGKSFNKDLGTINVAKFNQELIKTHLDMATIKNDLQNISQGSTAFNILSSSILSANAQIKTANKALDQMAITLKNTVRYGISSSIFNNFANSFQKAYSYARDLDESLNNIRIVTDASASKMEQFAVSANEASKRLGASTLAYTDAALIYYQQGLSDEEAKARAEVTLKAANVTGQSAQEVSEQLTAVWNGYKVNADEAELYVDKLAAVAATTAADLEELSTGMSKVASAANLMGVDVDQLNAQLATIVSVTRQAPESVGTALKTIYARMGDIESGISDETTLGNYTQEMANMGINVLDMNGKLRDMGEVIEEIGNKWTDLSREQQIALSQTMAGTRQYNNLLALFDNWGMYTDAIKTSQNAVGTLQKQQDIYMESTEAHLKRLQATWEDLYDSAIDSSEVNAGIDLLNNLIQTFDNFIDSFGGGIKSIGALGAVLSNVFNKQISEAITNFVQNTTRMQQNIDLLEKKRQAIQLGAAETGITTPGDEAQLANTSTQLKYAQQIREVEIGISQEQYNQLTNLQAQMGELEQKAVLLEKESEANTRKVLGEEEYQKYLAQELKDEEEIANYWQKGINSANEELEIRKNALTYLEKQVKYTDHYLLSEEELVDVQEEINGLINRTSGELEKELKSATKNIDFNKATLKEKEKILDIVRKIVKEQENEVETSKRNAQAIEEERTNKEEAARLRAQEGQLSVEFENTMNYAKQATDIAERVTMVTSSLSSMVSVWSAVNSLFQTWNDENATLGDKITQTFMTLSMTIPTVVTAFKSLKGISDLYNLSKAKTIAMQEVETALRTKELAGLSEEAILQKAVSLVKQQGVAMTEAEIAARLQNVGLLKTESVAHGANATAKTAETGATTGLTAAQTALNASLLAFPGTWIIAVLAAVVGAIALVSNAEKEAREEIVKGNNALIDSENQIQANIEKNKELYKTYNDLYEQYKLGKANKEDMAKATSNLTDLLTAEEIRVINLTGAYEGLNAIIRDRRLSELTKELESSQREQALAGANLVTRAKDADGGAVEPDDRFYTVYLQTGFDQEDEAKALDIVTQEFGEDMSKLLSLNGLDWKVWTANTEAGLIDLYDKLAKVRDNIKITDKEGYGDSEVYKSINKWIESMTEEVNKYKAIVKEVETYTLEWQALNHDFTTKNLQDFESNRNDLIAYIHSMDEYTNASDEKVADMADTYIKSVTDSADKMLQRVTILNELISKFGEENRDKIINTLNNISDEDLSYVLQVDEQESLTSVEKYFEKVNDKINEIKLSKVLQDELKALNVTEDQFKEYVETLEELNEEDKKASSNAKEFQEQTKKVALNVIKTNNAVEALSKSFETNRKIIEDNNTSSYDYVKALGDVKEQIETILGIEVSNDFVTQHLDIIQNLVDGEAEALDRLRIIAAQDIIQNLKIELDDEEIASKYNIIQDFINHFDGSKITIDSAIDDKEFVNALNFMIKQGQITAEQATKILSSIGYQPSLGVEKVPKKETHTYTRTDPDTGELISRVQETDEYELEVPIINADNTLYKGSGQNIISYNNNANKGKTSSKKSGGGGGSKAKTPDTDEFDKELNRYHDIDIELSNISISMKRLDDQQKKLFGKDLIVNINKQMALLDKQIDATTRKMAIMADELKEMQGEMSKKYGFTFDDEGYISNYAAIVGTKIDAVAELSALYNQSTAEEQEAMKKNLDDQKKYVDELIKMVETYDTKRTKDYEDLIDNRTKALDEKITKAIQKFDMEIEIRLDMAEAERNWNDFKKKIIDGIENDDILGNAKAKLLDFSSYYKEDDKGIVQALTRQVNDTLTELSKMDNGLANVYGNNRTKALEDLNKYYTTLMENLENVLELQQEIHEQYIKMQDEAQKKFDEQIESYQMVSDLIDHDMKVIQLAYGEKSYSALSKYYDKQEENNNKQLDFQKQQVNFWKQQMDSLEKGSKAWENARDNWRDAVADWKKLIEEGIEDLQNKYLNSINLIFQDLNNKVTGGLGLDYVNEEWTLINKNAEQYLDNINNLYETQALENKYLEAIEKTDSVGAQRQLKEIMDAELKDLRERDKLTQYDIDRANKRYEIALKQIALQEAQQNKTKMRLRRDSQGNYRYEYTTDSDQVSQLENELDGLYNSLYNFDKARFQENMSQIYSTWVEFQEKMAEAAQINDPEERAKQEYLLKKYYGELIDGLYEQSVQVQINLQSSAFEDLARLYDKDVAEFTKMTDDEKNALMNELVPQWNSSVKEMANAFGGEDGFLGVCKDAFDELDKATETYENSLNELQDQAGENFEEIYNGIDETIGQTEELIVTNDELIGKYEDEMSAIGELMSELDALVEKYNAARDAAIEAVEAAYRYENQARSDAADAARDEANSSASQDNMIAEAVKQAAEETKAVEDLSAKGGDGSLTIGETATYTGSYYYDSYGTAPSGKKYSGVADGVVIDAITNNPYGVHIHSADGRYRDLGWIKKSQLSGYDTGGYTGAWGNDGRLALLHQKELVLNANDTENMLNAVTIMRDITNTLGNSVLNRLAGITAANTNGTVTSGLLDQNVNIQATFPNVTNSREIEDALNNLVNMAAIRANRKGS